MYRELESRLPAALAHAARLLAHYNPPNPMQDRPATRVHALVEQLLRYAAPPGR